MKSTKLFTADDYRIQLGFETARAKLLEKEFSDRLDKPLGFWALPNDRRLPIAFLGRRLGELLRTPFDDLVATPGIGQKKIDSMVMLLERAIENKPTSHRANENRANPPNGRKGGNDAKSNGAFDPSAVSEVVWTQWCERVKTCGLGFEKLGRLTPSLQAMPTVIWNTRLDYYLDRPLQEIRSLKTHGEKRVQAVLEIFYQLNKAFSQLTEFENWAFRLYPRSIALAQDWLNLAAEDSSMLLVEEIKSCLAAPLIRQIEIDAGAMVRQLVEGRLAINGPQVSVRTQSRRNGVTRARIYQLFEDCEKIMSVRWPNGQCHLDRLLKALRSESDMDESYQLVKAIRDLFYPDQEDRWADED